MSYAVLKVSSKHIDFQVSIGLKQNFRHFNFGKFVKNLNARAFSFNGDNLKNILNQIVLFYSQIRLLICHNLILFVLDN